MKCSQVVRVTHLKAATVAHTNNRSTASSLADGSVDRAQDESGVQHHASLAVTLCHQGGEGGAVITWRE